MYTEVICTVIALAGTIFSGLISWLVSHHVANKEIEKARLTWEREDVVSSEDEFADMASSIALYLQTLNISDWNAAVSKVAAVRSKETGILAEYLDNLYFSLKSQNIQMSEDNLTQVIEEKRKRKSPQSSAAH